MVTGCLLRVTKLRLRHRKWTEGCMTSRRASVKEGCLATATHSMAPSQCSLWQDCYLSYEQELRRQDCACQAMRH